MIDRYRAYPGAIYWMDTSKTGRILVKVLKVNPRNIKVETASGRVWNCPPVYLHDATASEAASFVASAGTAADGLVMGQVVKFTSGGEEGLFVVCGEHSGGYRLARLGGDKGRYYRGIRPSQVEVVNFELEGV